MRSTMALLLLATAVLPVPLHAQSPELPSELRGWQDWVLQDREYLRCPYLGGADATVREGRLCVWPGPIAIDAGPAGASFSQQLQVYASGFMPLPGDAQAWPQDVQVDGRAAPVVARGGRPHLRLEAGVHRLSGRLAWSEMPESISLPASVSLVELRIGGTRIPLPERTGDNLRLGASRVETQADRLDLQVYRRLVDSVPGTLTTRLRFNVAGRPREALVGPLLPEGFVPMQLTGPLPVRLQPDGRLRVQARPGTWEFDLESRAASALTTVQLPTSGVAEEVWSFEAVDPLRSASIEGLPGIDPSQANVPEEWQGLPAYRLAPGDSITITERSRGGGDTDRNRVEVERSLWRDFDGSGYTFQDNVVGHMQQDWRLEMAPPWSLQGARLDGRSLLVTQRENDRAGVELRAPDLGLEATGRLARDGGTIAATGWDTRLASLVINLQLPPGHRLLAAPGVDVASSAWLNRWRLLDVFAVLLVAAVALRVAGVPAATLAILAFTLTHHELPALTWAALNLLIAIALARAVPEGRVRSAVRAWRTLSAIAVIVLFVPFSLMQARLAFFPQLERTDGGGRGDMITVTASRREAAAPPAELAEDAAAASDAAASSPGGETYVHGSRFVRERYAPGTQLQNGPGVPQWNYQSHRLQWSGPVEPVQRMRLVIVSPFWLSLWRIAGIVLVVLALYAFARDAWPRIGRPPLDRWLRLAPATAVMLLASAMPFMATPARAQAPAPELLQELQRRLSQPPKCAPDCVAISRARVEIENGTLEIRLEVHAQALAALALPEAPQRWQPAQVLLGGTAAGGLARDAGGVLALAVPEGVHEVILRGAMPEVEALRLVFREAPARIEVVVPGWQVAGVDDERLLADSLSLLRPVPAAGAEAAGARSGTSQREEFPPFVRVTRTLHLGLDWTVSTQVERLAPEQGAFALRLPLLPGESVLTAGLPTRDGQVELAMPAGVAQTGWESTLARADTLELVAPAAVPWVEVWRFEVSPIWHLDFEGTPEVLADSSAQGDWVHQFVPRPSESLAVTVTRPAAVIGPTFAFERIQHTIEPGRRSTDTRLELGYRSTQGGRQDVTLPAGARLLSVKSDGAELSIRDQDGRLALPLAPGEHVLEVAWQSGDGMSIVHRPGAVTIGAPASNVRTVIAVPASRWLLFAAGGGVGPAILYWAELAVFVVLALLLGRLRRTPLATHEWLLVGLGLSTFSWSVLLIFAAWVFAFEWRARWRAEVRPAAFNAVQVGLVALTLLALGSLLAAIPNGLLGTPDMRIEGAGSHNGLLQWFHDRVDATLPRPLVISVSIWFYKAAMLAWALWLSFALVRWVRWAWHAGGAQGLWRRRPGTAPQIG